MRSALLDEPLLTDLGCDAAAWSDDGSSATDSMTVEPFGTTQDRRQGTDPELIPPSDRVVAILTTGGVR